MANSDMRPRLKNIGCDIDGVLADFVGTYNHNYLGPALKRVITDEDITTFTFEEVFPKLSAKEHRALFKKATDEHILENLDPYYNGIPMLLRSLDSKNVCYITSRAYQTVPETYKWFIKNRIPFSGGIYFVDDKEITKQMLAKQLGLEVFIEDAMHQAIPLAEVVETVLLVDRPWNRSGRGMLPDNVHVIKDVNQIKAEHLFR